MSSNLVIISELDELWYLSLISIIKNEAAGSATGYETRQKVKYSRNQCAHNGLPVSV